MKFSPPNNDREPGTRPKTNYLSFSVSKNEYKIATRHIIDIIYLQSLGGGLALPSFIWSAINVRGNIIPTLEVQARLGLPTRDRDGRTCIVVVGIDGRTLGLALSPLRKQVKTPPGNMEPAENAIQHFICGIGNINGKMNILLNMNQFILW